MRYLVTGHTGFKGSWLALWLAAQGHEISGIALDPPTGGLYESADVASVMRNDIRLDIREANDLADAVAAVSPEVVLHLAAQPLVRESYSDPRTTIETNVLGTLNVLEAVSRTPGVRAQVVITTDKVYRNVDQEAGYIENDPLGGADPYSASKAMADILTQSWTTSFPGVPTAIARGGNVIGGGDVSKDRLLPDLLAAFESGTSTNLRYPDAVRPWQHVLDCLNGYLALATALLNGVGTGEWNFGPGRESFVPVREVAERATSLWGGAASWTDGSSHDNVHEANLLALDAGKAQRELGWANRLPFPASLEWTVEWQKRVTAGSSARMVTMEQIAAFEALAVGGP